MAIINLTKDNFQEETSEGKVLIDFWADWCGPCKTMGPVLEEMDGEPHDFKICKVNVDEQQELAQKFQIRSIPTMVVLKDGQQAAVTVGAQPKANVVNLVNNA